MGDGGEGAENIDFYLLSVAVTHLRLHGGGMGGKNAQKYDYVIYGWFPRFNKIPPPVQWT